MANETTLDLRGLRDLVGTVRRHLRSRLWLQILIAMAAGIGVGFLLSEDASLVAASTAEAVGHWLAFPGQLFLALIQMIVIPLIIASIVLGVGANEDLAYLKRLALRIVPYFVLTTAVAAAIGIGLASLIRPGRYVEGALVERALAGAGPATEGQVAQVSDQTLPEQIVALIPANPLGAALEQSLLQVVVFAILVGIALVSIPNERARPLLLLAGSVQELSMKVVSWAMVIAPLAVFGLLARITLQVGVDALVGMGVYVGTVLAGLACLVLVYLALVALFARRSPWAFLRAVRDAQLLAFSTSSSAAVMPLSMETAEARLDVSPTLARFVIPLGATVNMDGTALYQVVAALFVTQVFGVELALDQLVFLTITTVGASIGAPSTPGVGIVILATILTGIGLPASGVALVIGVDRILDMCRTAVNVTGDLTACVVLDRWITTPREASPAG